MICEARILLPHNSVLFLVIIILIQLFKNLDPGVIETYVDMLALQTAYARFLVKPVDCSEEDIFTIYLSVSRALWLRQSEGLLSTG